eukprot:jgi/Mesvir1/13229/Mv12754-RA.3
MSDCLPLLLLQFMQAAAAMAVGVGSFQDPTDANGLAHFLEHMLFMGSEKYPDENEYDSFLSMHGGGSNAFTECESTCFHFDISNKHLRGALDRFAQFFIAPLCKAEAMDREVQAVESEFNQVLQDDSCRLQQVQCSTSVTNHPFRIFSWGNRKSLVDDPASLGVDMRQKLLHLYDAHYGAENMCLALLGGYSLDELSSMAAECFGPVRSLSSRPGGTAGIRPSLKGLPSPFSPVAGKLHTMQAVKDHHLLNLVWVLPCLFDRYGAKAEDYVAHLMGHEARGSILHALKKKGWVLELSAGVGEGGYERNTACFVFSVSIKLTEEGRAHVWDIVSVVYQFLTILREAEPLEWVYRELETISNLKFQFQEEEEASNYVVRLSGNLHRHPPAHALNAEYLYNDWDPALVSSVIDALVPSNMRLDLVTKSFPEGTGSGQRLTEPWFRVPYLVEDVPKDVLAGWERGAVDPSWELAVPPRNPLIATRLEIAPIAPGDEAMPCPRLVVNTPVAKLWYFRDTTFLAPRTNVYFAISSDAAYRNPREAALTELYLRLLEDSLTEISYMASLAELYSSIAPHTQRLELKLNGFSDKLPVYADQIFQAVAGLVVKQDRFEVVREELARAIKNTNLKPMKHVSSTRLHAIKVESWHVDQLLPHVESCTAADVQEYFPQYLAQAHVEGLVHGDLPESEAQAILASFLKHVMPEAAQGRPAPTPVLERVVRLKSGVEQRFVFPAKNKSEDNSAVENYFQIAPETSHPNLYALAGLLEQALHEPFFDQLRTKEQLGYTVDCGMRCTHGVVGFALRVQSATHGPEHINSRMTSFLVEAVARLRDMSPAEFDKHRAALISAKKRKPTCMLEASDRQWEQIWERRYDFDHRAREVSVLETLTLADLQAFFATYLAPDAPQRRRLMINVYGKNHVDELQRAISGGTTTPTAGGATPVPVVTLDLTPSMGELVAWKNERGCYPFVFEHNLGSA